MVRFGRPFSVIGRLMLTMACAAAFASAADVAPLDLDQGVDIKRMLDAARASAADASEGAPRIGNGRSVMLSKIPLAGGLARLPPRPDDVETLGWVYGPFRDVILNNGPYSELVGLRRNPRYSELPADVRGPLDSEWVQINSTRQELLAEATGLEPLDQKLYDDRVTLENRRSDLERRLEILNRDIDQWNRECGDRVLPPAKLANCEERRNELRYRRGKWETERDAFNRDVAAWNQRSEDLNYDVKSWRQRVAAWERRIQALINNIRNAWGGPGGELCTLVEPPQGQACLYTCPSGRVESVDPPVPGEVSSCPRQMYFRPKPPPPFPLEGR